MWNTSRFASAMLLASSMAYAAPPIYQVRALAGSDWIGDGGAARDSLLFQAEGLAADRDGNLYIADAQSHRVRQITPAGVISTFAGTGAAGFSGDGGPASEARLSSPYGLAVDPVGNLYIADLGNRRVRRVARDGRISTIAAEVPFRAPRNVAADLAGNLYVSDFESGSVYRISTTGTTSVVALLKFPAGLAVDRNGSLYVGETGTHSVRKLVNGAVQSIATVQTPTGLAFDTLGTLYVADASGGGIFRIPLTGTAAPLVIAARDVAAGTGGVLYSTDGRLVRRIVSTGNTVIAGRGDTAHGDYGPATEARLNHPAGLALDGAGNLYIADRDNHRIRRVDTQGIITTFAGSGISGDSGDGGLAGAASLNQPAAISFDEAGFLYIADQGNARIRVVSPSGIISAAASMPRPADIFPVLETDVPISPTNLIAGKDGILYASDADRNRVWELTPPALPPDPSTLISIVNAASLTGPLAPEMLVMVQGLPLLTPELFFDGLPATRVAPTAFVVPSGVNPGSVPVEVRDNGALLANLQVAVVPAAPALFVAVNQDGSVNAAEQPAERGSIVVLYGTGQGVGARPVAVHIGAYDSEVLYSGPAAGYPGLWQVNARVPSGFLAPGTLPIMVASGDAVSPAMNIFVR